MKSFILILILLTACGFEQSNVVKPIPQQNATVIDIPTYKTSPIKTTAIQPHLPAILLTREYIHPGEKITATNINYIFLPHKPISVTEIKQYNLVCEIWKKSLIKNKEALAEIKENDNIATLPIYWPLKYNVKSEDCNELINNYDYVGMQIVGINYNFNANELLLICRINDVSIVMNLSSLKNEDELMVAFTTWREKICKPVTHESRLYAYTVLLSAKKVLGVLASLITMKV